MASRRAEDDAVPRLVDVLGRDDVPVVADGDDRPLVDEVGEVGSGEARRGPRHGVEVDVRSEMLLVRVHLQDRGTLGLVGERDLDLAVEPARTQQGRVEHLGAVRGGHDDDRPSSGRSRPSRPGAGSASARVRRWRRSNRPASGRWRRSRR